MIYPQDKEKLLLPVPGPDVVVRGDWFPPDADHEEPWTLVRVNVPWSVVWHSPTGFGVGYGGSGPSDLALNILQQFLPGEDVVCLKGTKCSTEAARLHHQFKDQFIAPMPAEGGRIPEKMIREWIRRHGQLRDRLKWLLKVGGGSNSEKNVEHLVDTFMDRFPEVRVSWGMDPDLDRLRRTTERFLVAAGHAARMKGEEVVTTRATPESCAAILVELCMFLELLEKESDELLMRKPLDVG